MKRLAFFLALTLMAAVHAAAAPVLVDFYEPNGYVSGMDIYNNILYVAGQFTTLRNTATGSITPVRAGIAAIDLCTHKIRPNFPAFITGAGGFPPSPAFGGPVIGPVAASGNLLYVGGFFTTFNGVPHQNLAAVDLTTGALAPWNPNAVFTGGQNGVGALECDAGSNLYFGGIFNSFRFAPSAIQFYLTGRADVSGAGNPFFFYNTLPTLGHVQALRFDPATDQVFVGYQNVVLPVVVNGLPRSGVMALDAATGAVKPWNTPGLTLVSDIEVSGGFVYLVDNTVLPVLRRCNSLTGAVDATWNPPAVPALRRVDQIAFNCDSLYVLGQSFPSAAGLPTNPHYYRLNPSTGATLDSGFPFWGTGYLLETFGDELIVGGTFNTVNSVPRNALAMLQDPGSLCGHACIVPSSTFTPTSSRTPSLTATLTRSPTLTSTPTATSSFTATRTRTASPTATLTSTATATSSRTPTSTRTATGTFSSTVSPSFTATPTSSRTSTQTLTWSDTSTSTQTSTATASPTSTFTPTDTATSTATDTPSVTPTFSFTMTDTSTSTRTPTSTRTASPTRTDTRTVTPTRSITPTSTATPTRSDTRSVTVTRSVTQTWTNTGTETITRTWTDTRTVTVTRTCTQTRSTTMSETFTPTPSISKTLTTTPSQSESPTMTVTASASVSPSSTPNICMAGDGQPAAFSLGQPDLDTGTPPGAPASAGTLSHPWGLAVGGGMLFVADQFNHRVLGYPLTGLGQASLPTVVIGQTTFTDGGQVFADQQHLEAPHGVATDGIHLAIADTSNNRVLLFDSLPTGLGALADHVIGQIDFVHQAGNRGGSVQLDTLLGPESVAIADGRLFIADTQNARVLVFNSWPTSNGQAPDLILDQALSPVAVSAKNGKLLVADAANRRVLVWNSYPTVNFQPADVVIGQDDFTSSSPGISPTRFASITTVAYDGVRVIVGDAANRVLIFNNLPTMNGAAADYVLGQPDLNSSGLSSPSPYSMNFPAGVASDGNLIFVSSQGESRVLIYGCQAATPTALGLGLASAARMGSSKTVAADLRLPLGVEALLAPNPAKDRVDAIFVSAGLRRIKLTVFNLSGDMVFQTAIQEVKADESAIELSVSHIADGIYLVVIVGEDEMGWSPRKTLKLAVIH